MVTTDRSKKYMVATLCKTYNHASYIKDALKGFAMQETTFPCVYIIIDDASTDGEPDILRDWSERNLVIVEDSHQIHSFGERYIASLKGNSNSMFVIILLSENHHGKKSKKKYYAEWTDNAKYIALCEGDDYWIDKYKLQMQVDYMERYRDCSLCFTNVDIICEDKSLDMHLYDFLEERDYSGDEMLLKWTVPVCSMLYKSYIAQRRHHDSRFCVGDNVLILACAENGIVHCINKKTGVYRRILNGWTARQKTSSEECLRWISHYKALRDYFPRYTKSLDVLISKRYSTLTLLDAKQMRLKCAIRDVCNGISFGCWTYFKTLTVTFLKALKRQ